LSEEQTPQVIVFPESESHSLGSTVVLLSVVGNLVRLLAMPFLDFSAQRPFQRAMGAATSHHPSRLSFFNFRPAKALTLSGSAINSCSGEAFWFGSMDGIV